MKLFVLLASLLLTTHVQASFRAFSQTAAELGHFAEDQCGVNEYCYSSNGKFVHSPHYKYSISTSTVATAAMCGVTFVVSADSTITLPEASTVPGCRYEFVNGQSTWTSGTLNKNLKIDPADGVDRIVVLTSDAGDRLRTSTLGSSVVLEAVGNDVWAPIGAQAGTWDDFN